MQIISRLVNQHSLLRQIISYILFISILISFLLSCLQAYLSFNQSKLTLETHLSSIEHHYSDVIATSLWEFNENIIQQQLNSIAHSPDITYVKLFTDYNREYVVGDEDADIDKSIKVAIQYDNKRIGELMVYANYDHIYEQLNKQILRYMVVLLIQSFVLLLCFTVLIRYLLVQRIEELGIDLRNLTIDELTNQALPLNSATKNIAVENKPHTVDSSSSIYNPKDSHNELSQLTNSIHCFLMKIKNDITTKAKIKSELLAQNEQLEHKIFERTELLEHCQQQLQSLQSDFTLAKHKLIESEKMVSLGQLVSGITHEANTPLGICITSASAIGELNDLIITKINNETLTRKELLSSLDTMLQYQQMTEKSLHKAIELINDFKTFAVEQQTDPQVNIYLAKHIEDVTKTVKTLFRHCHYQFNFDMDDKIEMVTFPSAWNQILTNLLINSYEHGFEKRSEGDITITLTKQESDIILQYYDNGKGIDKKLMHVIFEPFVTSKGGQKGRGLGLSIVYNLVTNQLGGNIEHVTTEQGTQFVIKAPFNG